MLDLDTVNHLAELSMLSFDDEERKRLATELEDIKKLMDKVKGQESLPCFSLVSPIKYKMLRCDKAFKSMDKKRVLANAKKAKDFGFSVPRIV